MTVKNTILLFIMLHILSSMAQKSGRSVFWFNNIRPHVSRTVYGASQALHDDSQFIDATRLVHMSIAKEHEKQQQFIVQITQPTPQPTPYPTPYVQSYLKETPKPNFDILKPIFSQQQPVQINFEPTKINQLLINPPPCILC